jgi:hypothetical protein
VINKLDYPLLDDNWTADEELMLFEGLEKYLEGYSDMASGTGAKLLISSELTKPAKTLKSTTPTISSKALTSSPYL